METSFACEHSSVHLSIHFGLLQLTAMPMIYCRLYRWCSKRLTFVWTSMAMLCWRLITIAIKLLLGNLNLRVDRTWNKNRSLLVIATHDAIVILLILLWLLLLLSMFLLLSWAKQFEMSECRFTASAALSGNTSKWSTMLFTTAYLHKISNSDEEPLSDEGFERKFF